MTSSTRFEHGPRSTGQGLNAIVHRAECKASVHSHACTARCSSICLPVTSQKGRQSVCSSAHLLSSSFRKFWSCSALPRYEGMSPHTGLVVLDKAGGSMFSVTLQVTEVLSFGSDHSRQSRWRSAVQSSARYVWQHMPLVVDSLWQLSIQGRALQRLDHAAELCMQAGTRQSEAKPWRQLQ